MVSLIFGLLGRQRNHFNLLCLFIRPDDLALIGRGAGGIIYVQHFPDIPVVFLHQTGQDRRPAHDIFSGGVRINAILFGGVLFQLHQAQASPFHRFRFRVISRFDGADRLDEEG